MAKLHKVFFDEIIIPDTFTSNKSRRAFSSMIFDLRGQGRIVAP